MAARIVESIRSTLPEDDDHPYRTGAWRPNHREWDAWDLEVEGEIPEDLEGVYLRNTENPVHPSIGLYHPFDGDGMLHQIAFAGGEATYRNRFVRTDGLRAEQEAAQSLWTGFYDLPENSRREDGWGARGRMKDASSTDVVVHNGVALTTLLAVRRRLPGSTRAPSTSGARRRGPATSRARPASPRTRSSTSAPVSCWSSATARRRRTCTTAWWTRTARWRTRSTYRSRGRGCRTTWRSPRTTRSSTTSRCSGTRELLATGLHLPRFFPDVPTRFAVVPRRGRTEDIRWFEADPTYVLHWINAYEDGDEIVLDGFFQHDPEPSVGPAARRWLRCTATSTSR